MPRDMPHDLGGASPNRADRLAAGAAPTGAGFVGTASQGGNTQRPDSIASRTRTTIEAELVRIPSLDEWPDLGARELERRARVLADIRQRIMEHGPHHAIADPDRGRLFMPFAALKGYDDLVKCVEDE